MSQLSIGGLDDFVDFRIDFWDGWNLYTTLDTSTTKNIFSAIFTLLGIAIALLGAYFLRRRNLHQLTSAREEDRMVEVTQMTSWLSLAGTLTYTWKTRRLPSGFWGVLMVFAGAFSVAQQFFVNSFIVNSKIFTPDYCQYTQGVVTEQHSGERSKPVSHFTAATTIYNAQLNAVNNGGVFGIWSKVPRNSTGFCPYDVDVLGRWNCTNKSSTLISYENWVNKSSINQFLNNQAFQYNESYDISLSADPTTNVLQGFLGWSANETNDSNNTWALRASVATKLGSSIDSHAYMANIDCHLVNKSPGNWTPPIMPSDDTLSEWTDSAYGFLMSTDAVNSPVYLEWKLNQMTMTAGGGNVDTLGVAFLKKGQRLKYGCVLTGTQIHYGLWVVFGLLLLVLIPMALATVVMWIVYLLRTRNDGKNLKNERVEQAKLCEDQPENINGWQLALLREAVNDKSLTEKDFRDYSYGWNSVSGKFGFYPTTDLKAANLSTLPTKRLEPPTTKPEAGHLLHPSDN